MNFFNDLINFKMNDKVITERISEFNNIDNLASQLQLCYESNKQQCFINKINKTIDISGIILTIDDKITIISWEHFFKINNYLNKNINFHFNIKNNFFNIFFIKFYFNNKQYFNSKSSYSLCGFNNAIFGIYNTYINNVQNTIYNLYFSYGLGTFILDKVKDKKINIIGKLCPWINYNQDNHSLIINNKEFNCPNSFYIIKKSWYAINKNKNFNKQIINNYNEKLILPQSTILDNLNNDNIHFSFNLPFELNKYVLKELCIYIFTTIPILKDTKNYFNNSSENIPNKNIDFGIIFYKKNITVIIGKKIYAYSEVIIGTINYFFAKKPIPKLLELENNKKKLQIHLLTEIYYIFVYILYYLIVKYFISSPKQISNDWIQSNIKFEKHEINTLYNDKPEVFNDNIDYIIAVIIKTINIKLDYHMVILNKSNNTYFIPLIKPMSNNTYLDIIQKNNKSFIGKSLMSYLINKINNINKNIELPFILINTIKVGYLEINKIKTVINEYCIPIKINIYYSDDDKLEIIICSNNKYSHLTNLLLECFNLLVKPELTGADSISMISTTYN
jgi:hypothetical protein